MQTTTKNPLTALTLAITLGVWVHANPVSATGIAATRSATWSTEQQQTRHRDGARQHLEKAKGLLMELKSEITAEGNKRSAARPHGGNENSRSDQTKTANTCPDVIRGKHQQASEALKTAGIKQQYHCIPVAITLGKMQSALRSFFTKGILLANAADKDPSGKTCRTTYRSQVHRQGHFDGVLTRSPIA